MAISFNFGAASQGTGVTKTLKPWNYSSAFRIISDSGTLARMTDILSPLDKLTTAKVTLEKIANVYTTLAGGTVPLAAQNANVSGHTVFVELKTIATKIVNTVTVQLPIVSRIEIRLPDDADIAEADIDTLVMATYGLLCDAAGLPTVVTEKMRGALTPVGI
jgi:hypothetical protein